MTSHAFRIVQSARDQMRLQMSPGTSDSPPLGFKKAPAYKGAVLSTENRGAPGRDVPDGPWPATFIR